jgi:hypothetical protein
MSVLPRKRKGRKNTMDTELSDVIAVCRKIRGNDKATGAYYLLGYIWGITPKEKREAIYELFLAEVDNE